MLSRQVQTCKRSLSTYVMRGRLSKPATKESLAPAVCVTGFSGGYLPTKEDFHMIVSKSFRPDIKPNGELSLPKNVPSKPDDMFDMFMTHLINSSEGEVVFRLKSKELMSALPLARNLEHYSMAPSTNHTRTAWCGMLLPILNGKIIHLNRKARSSLRNGRQWERIRWYPLVFRTFQPDMLNVECSSEDEIYDAMERIEPRMRLERLHGDRSSTTLTKKVKFTIKCEFSEDIFALRDALAREGLRSRPLESSKFDLAEAFRQSEFRKSVRSRQASVLKVTMEAMNETPASMVEETTEISRDLENEELFVSEAPPRDELSFDVLGDDYYDVEETISTVYMSRRDRYLRRLQLGSLGQEIQERAFS